MKLAEALLRRKELAAKVKQLAPLREADLFKVTFQRKSINDNIDDIVAKVPLLSAAQVTAEHDHYAKQLRIVDAVIQQANWTTDITPPQDVMGDYIPPATLTR